MLMISFCSLLFSEMQNGKQMVQEGALTALASVADSSQVLTCYSFSDSIYFLTSIWD